MSETRRGPGFEEQAAEATKRRQQRHDGKHQPGAPAIEGPALGKRGCEQSAERERVEQQDAAIRGQQAVPPAQLFESLLAISEEDAPVCSREERPAVGRRCLENFHSATRLQGGEGAEAPEAFVPVVVVLGERGKLRCVNWAGATGLDLWNKI